MNEAGDSDSFSSLSSVILAIQWSQVERMHGPRGQNEISFEGRDERARQVPAKFAVTAFWRLSERTVCLSANAPSRLVVFSTT